VSVTRLGVIGLNPGDFADVDCLAMSIAHIRRHFLQRRTDVRNTCVKA
jgi:hypothetical protein